MRTLRTIALCSLMIAAAAGCKKKSDDSGSGSAAMGSGSDTGSAGSAAGSDTGSAAAGSAMGSAAGSGAAPQVNTPPEPVADAGAAAIDTTNMAHKAGNCPSTVAGAATAIADSKDGKGVVLTITSKDKEAVWAIQTRAKNLAAQQKTVAKAGDKVQHSGKGTGGGGTGLCPVVSRDTKMAVANQKDGVAITLTPAGKLTLDALKADVQSRADKAAELTKETVQPGGGNGGGGGTGGGTGKHGGNRTGKGDGSGPKKGETAKSGATGGPTAPKGTSGAAKQGGGNHM